MELRSGHGAAGSGKWAGAIDIRQGIKDYANWPTIPQLYVNGEFVGGADIMREMYDSGELQQLLSQQTA